ncbi:uncharacterized protein PAC_12185 [Phialocephala subalpina]|uniref:G domain-containing protein n=1 Tax=Phialocephala subalpina TaxID=576137 RepID=A0A1L7XB76_9HELO|nr:uncharacterized protein PAC_12185 [Phialocephala subalpina]
MARTGGAITGLPGNWKDAVTPLDKTYFRGGFEPQPNDVFIGVMGVTGAGKSTFIDLLTDSKDIKVGHGLQSLGTQKVMPYLYQYSEDTNVYVIDTPGFDDTNRSDTEVLIDIVDWLSESIRTDVKLSGMLYFHRIIDPRMSGSAKKNLHMFKALCGSEQFSNIILVTTMWEKVSRKEGQAREKELRETEEFWGLMVQQGSRMERHDNTTKSAKKIVKWFVEKKRVELDIQNEIVKQDRELYDTAAGKTLESELLQERERSGREQAKAKAAHERALQQQKEELAKIMREQEKQARREVRKRNEEIEKLKLLRRAADLRAEHERKERETQEQEQKRLWKVATEMEALSRSGLSQKPRTRSHPGQNRIQECRSISLIDNSYFFCGPDQCER